MVSGRAQGAKDKNKRKERDFKAEKEARNKNKSQARLANAQKNAQKGSAAKASFLG